MRPFILKKGLVDHGIKTFEGRIGLFNMDDDSLRVERFSKSKSLYFPLNKDDPSLQF
jgi:hypothetical protein